MTQGWRGRVRVDGRLGLVLDHINLREGERAPNALCHLIRARGRATQGDGSRGDLEAHLHALWPDELLDACAADSEASSYLASRQALT